ncbi:MAG: bifunctional acetate--CoA ligase family protein/GNAT family N-acetyltransferase [Acidobacteria bacterium]|nr:bifunctional acetate--CoA ligase family protein/GNAT family N-acetyltransferase [Acidobacteriota bacterium]
MAFATANPAAAAGTAHPLDAFFTPKNIAVIGATENPGSVGRTTLWNLLSTPFGGAVFPVNPKRSNVLGIKAYSGILQVPEPVDLAVVVTPAPSIPQIIHECGEAGVKAAVVISAGFKELGPPGVELERQLSKEAQQYNMRIVGPNCLGLMSPLTGVNATFARGMAAPGNIGFISQSGALCTAVLDWSFQNRVGFSAFVSLGSMLDVNWGDLIQYLGRDTRTRAILIYMESIGDARSFLSAAREVALTKPIIVIKAGRTAQGGKAAASHTGSLTGSDDVLDAAFRRVGVLRVDRISDLFYMAEVLGKQPRPKGNRLTILTNAGGPAVLATDSLIGSGGELSELSGETVEKLNGILPVHWSHGNPIDILGDASADRYAKSLEIAAKDPNSDGMLVVLTPQAMTDATKTAEALKPYAKLGDKPVLASWMGGPEVQAGVDILNRAEIPVFPYPDTAARAFQYMWSYTYNLKGLYETPTATESGNIHGSRMAGDIIRTVQESGRTLLTEFESKNLLASYGIPTVETLVAATADEAVARAEEMGFPVVLKLFSETITHKTDVGGVKLNLSSADAVRNAFRDIQNSVAAKAGAEHFQGVTVQKMIRMSGGYEIIIGSSVDPQFGPVLLFGLGGQLVEVFKDRALALPPLNSTLARRMMEQTRIYKALKGVRGRKPVDLAALEQLMVRFSQLVVEQPWIKEIDINPLLASSDGIVALDARVLLHEASAAELPKPAIRPYPTKYYAEWQLKDGTPVVIRPIRPEDEPMMVKFHETLSDRSVYLRYLHTMKLSQRVAHERLTRICFIDYDREIALVVEHMNRETGEKEILGVGRLQKLPGTNNAEFAAIVSDKWQGQGIGPELVDRLVKIAREEKLDKIRADVLADNSVMQRILSKSGFKLHREIGDPTIEAEFQL